MARPRWQEGTVFQRGVRKRVWVGRFREDAILADGRRVRRHRSVVLGPVSRKFGYRAARHRLSEYLAAINQGRHKPERRVTFSQFVLENWEPNIYPTLRASTVRNYRYLVRHYLLPAFGEMILPEIGPADVQSLLSSAAKCIAPRTVLSLRNRLLKIFGMAKRWGYIATNPAEGAQVPALADTRERLALTPEQARRLLEELPEPFRTMALVAILTGLRRGELFGLRWGRVDFEKGAILVAESSYQGHSSEPKTRASRRIVFVDAVVLDALRSIRPQMVNPEDLVFHSERGTPLNPENVRNRVLHPASERAGTPRVGWHTFRYTYATWADPTGESIKALQAQLGHTDSRLTLGVYTQPMPEAQRKIASKTARVLFPIVPKSASAEEVPLVEPKYIQ